MCTSAYTSGNKIGGETSKVSEKLSHHITFLFTTLEFEVSSSLTYKPPLKTF